MANLHFTARSRSGSIWGGLVQGSVARCAQRQFAAGAMEVEILGDQGRSVLRPEGRVHTPDQGPVAIVDADTARRAVSHRGRVGMRVAFWMLALIAIGLTAGAVFTINSARQSITDRATAALKAKGQEGIVSSSLADVEWDDGLVYHFQVLLDNKPALKASHEVFSGTTHLGR